MEYTKDEKMMLWLIPLIVFLVLISGSMLLKITVFDSWQESWDEAQAKCDEIEGCAKYGCYAELPNYSVRVKQKFLLQEQNCLLRQNAKTSNTAPGEKK